jgi:SAM-dependent methyltransferase
MNLKKNLNFQNCKIYDQLAEYYDLIYAQDEYDDDLLKEVNLPELLKGAFPDKERISILDLCCGTGRSLQIFQGKESFELYGVDCSEKMLERAKVNIPAGRFERCFLPDEDIPFKEKFHCILLLGATIHGFELNDRKKIYKKVRKLLDPKGCFVCDVLPFNAESSKNPSAKEPIKRADQTLIVIYYRESVKEKAIQHSFIIERKEPDGDWSFKNFLLEYFPFDRRQFERELTEEGFRIHKTWSSKGSEFVTAIKS